jgi:uncharacterized iron-regulated protein
MTIADAAATFAHPRGTWLDPSNGEEILQAVLLRDLGQRQVVLLGETHTVYEIHRWQLHVATMLHALHSNIAVGFEMFPRAAQDVLDDWVAGKFSSSAFLQAVDWPTVWGYDASLYLPLFHFCRQQRVRMLALNCHRPLVTRVGKEGWAAIPVDERDGLTPAADATPAYRRHLFEIMGGTAAPMQAKSADDPALDRFIRAQQTWDRAFACNIARALEQSSPRWLSASSAQAICASVMARRISCMTSASTTSRCCCRHSMPSTMRRRSTVSPTRSFGSMTSNRRHHCRRACKRRSMHDALSKRAGNG